MKFLLATSALAAASFLSPAFAQEAHGQVVSPAPKTATSVETSIDRTATATVETRVETIRPVSERPKLDPATPIAPEVQAVVSSGKTYTTQDIVSAQLDAMMKTPISAPTTTITTTTTTPLG